MRNKVIFFFFIIIGDKLLLSFELAYYIILKPMDLGVILPNYIPGMELSSVSSECSLSEKWTGQNLLFIHVKLNDVGKLQT